MVKTLVLAAESHVHVKLIKEYLSCIALGDFARAKPYLSEDIEFSVPGNNKLSGNFRGPEAVMNYCKTMNEITRGTHVVTKQEWMVNGSKVILITDNKAEIGEKKHVWKEVYAIKMFDGLNCSLEVFQEDQGAVDLFIGS